jgi:solute carrier family 15 (peptide/histidine transporter), member 3/4
LGLVEALNLVDQYMFYYTEFPKTMSSIGVSLQVLIMGFGAMLDSKSIGVTTFSLDFCTAQTMIFHDL